MDAPVRTMMDECYVCEHRRDVPGDCHIACVYPDPAMTGNEHGIRRGWFYYPLLFDPVWKTRDCTNFSQRGNGNG